MNLPLSFGADPDIKARVLDVVAAHQRAGTLVRGRWWRHGTGCVVGVLTHDPVGGHNNLARSLGIPVQLVWFLDHLHEAGGDPTRVIAEIPVGIPMQRWWPWLLSDLLADVTGPAGEMGGLWRQDLTSPVPASEFDRAAMACFDDWRDRPASCPTRPVAWLAGTTWTDSTGNIPTTALLDAAGIGPATEFVIHQLRASHHPART